jgi:hypothetical protein
MRFLKFFLCTAIILLCSCTSRHQHDVSDQAVRSCTSVCQQQLSHCKEVCEKDCKTCDGQSKQETRQHYKRYEHERCIEGKTLIRRLQSYHDPLQCRKMSCDCMADFRVCAQACRGQIQKQIQVEKSCC